ncbi:hypothetical protein CY0110_18882 [Crocosphaera chwakensis CCY0110]|uniref:Uncharacterized protein n=1 Tax=Crocosphaera chwakensis CCY0110 TaxID=391612 RepID=A3IJA8_9CHRO|nr:hypothetical protein CY0110_18882 [Crocosphaera chwakensis CCY0110]
MVCRLGTRHHDCLTRINYRHQSP